MLTNRVINYSAITARFLSTTNTLIARKGSNPGLNRVLNEITDAKEKIAEDPESFGDLESDFMNVHETHKRYTKETEAYREFIRLKVVQNKYFKQKYPNFLTFAEKEQIRILNDREPDVWTIEKLCESFPADNETIRKILKARWYPYSEQRLRKHDEKVIENWEKFRKGLFPELPSNLSNHLKNFAERKISDLMHIETKWLPKRPDIPKPKTHEFLSIITSCKPYQEKNLIEDKQNLNNTEVNKENVLTLNKLGDLKSSNEDETFIVGNINDKKLITLDELKNMALKDKVSPQISTGHDSKDNSHIRNSQTEPVFNSIQKFDFKEITISNSDVEKYSMSPIKERIYIPPKLWKKGATYKVKDCYYDYDGTFLYRVPGMTGDN